MNPAIQRVNQRSRETQINGSGLYKAIAVLCMTTFMVTTSSIKAQDCEPYWSEKYPYAHINGSPTCITIFDDGSGSGPRPYVGGWNMHSIDPAINNIAQLNENNGWSPLGIGIDGFVFALATFDDGSSDSDALYAVGAFSSAGEINANNIIKWDGQVWSALGEGLDGWGRVAVVFDDGSGEALYIGGSFQNAGGVSANRIVKWDGKNWSALGDGTDAGVRALAVFDDGSGPALYVGGFFENAGGVSAQNIARWDGTNWSPLGEGINSIVKSFTVFDDGSGPALYAGGSFSQAGGDAANNIAKWDGSVWSQVGTGTSQEVHDLAVVDLGNGPALFAKGSFSQAGGVYCERIAKWDGVSWSPLGDGLDGGSSPIYSAVSSFEDGSDNGPVLLAAGIFTHAGGNPSKNFAIWDGNEWTSAGGGLWPNRGITLLAVKEDSNVDAGLYVGGYFNNAGGIAADGFVHFKDEQWTPLGLTYGSSVWSLNYFDDGSGPALFVGGSFRWEDGMPTQHVAKWDGNSWSSLGDDLDGIVMSMCVFDDGAGDGPVLYAGGLFLHSGDTPTYYIAKWDGENWIGIEPHLSPYSDSVRTMIVFDDGTGYGDALYVGGNFYIGLDVDEFKNVVRWDGTEWSEMDNGSLITVYAFAVYDDGTGPALYASGKFGRIDELTVYGVGRWDGKEWSIVTGGDVTDGWIYTMQIFDDGLSDRPALYVGGRFDMIGSTEANQIARWDGENWSALGSGLETIPQINPYALSMAVFDDGDPQGESLYVTGSFLLADGKSSSNFAQWIPCTNPILGDLNGDGIVGTADLLILFANWGLCDDCNLCPADLDDNCTVGTSDMLILFSNWS